MLLATYRGLMRVATPMVPVMLALRARQKKEHPARRHERIGKPSIPRPNGFLLWIHAASIGESVSVLPLVERILQHRTGAQVLLTTHTVTAAAVMAKRLPRGAIHQFVPIDHPTMVKRFIEHWKPDAAFFVESELWPNLIVESKAAGIPMALVNARISERSFSRWKLAPASFRRRMFGAFDVIVAQDETIGGFFEELGAERVIVTGNLKFAAPPLSANPEAFSALEGLIRGRPRWLAASTHPGEEELIGEAHHLLKKHFPNLLTIVVPRHDNRGVQIAAMLRTNGLVTRLRSSGQTAGLDRADIYIGDTTGEMGLFFRLSPVVFMGGSLVEHGGQNPLEPARLNSAILHGPHVQNFDMPYQVLDDSGAAQTVDSAQELADAVAGLLHDRDERSRRAERAAAIGFDNSRVLDRVYAAIEPLVTQARHGEGA